MNFQFLGTNTFNALHVREATKCKQFLSIISDAETLKREFFFPWTSIERGYCSKFRTYLLC